MVNTVQGNNRRQQWEPYETQIHWLDNMQSSKANANACRRNPYGLKGE
jgi:hypothetical protein